ncbi:MAG: penicillin-binding transpeptidase domain-containing protein, partial [Candidatus Acidiferrales bacterium]
IQMAVMISAIANGGTVLWPRLVDRIEPQDTTSGEAAKQFPAGLVRDRLDVHPRNLQIIRDAMLQDVANSEGSGTAAAVEGYQICGKTGTAQVISAEGKEKATNKSALKNNAWFVGFAPRRNAEIVVAVLVQAGGYGAEAAAPVARDVVKAYYDKKAGTYKGPQEYASNPQKPAAVPTSPTATAQAAPATANSASRP